MYSDNNVFDDFPKISTDSTKIVRRPHERFQTFSENFQRLPKTTEDKQRLPKTFEENPKMF